MNALFAAALGGVIGFAIVALVGRWVGVPRRGWLPGALVLSAVVAALVYWANQPG
jgi:hypothetical protein